MTYEKFANRVKNDLQRRYSAELGDVEIELQDVRKLQGESYNGTVLDIQLFYSAMMKEHNVSGNTIIHYHAKAY